MRFLRLLCILGPLGRWLNIKKRHFCPVLRSWRVAARLFFQFPDLKIDKFQWFAVKNIWKIDQKSKTGKIGYNTSKNWVIWDPFPMRTKIWHMRHFEAIGFNFKTIGYFGRDSIMHGFCMLGVKITDYLKIKIDCLKMPHVPDLRSHRKWVPNGSVFGCVIPDFARFWFLADFSDIILWNSLKFGDFPVWVLGNHRKSTLWDRKTG